MKKNNLVILICLISPYLRSEIAFTQIKGLYNTLAEQFKPLSPLHGFNWWNIGIIENYYRFGDESHNTIKLINEIFYLQPDNITFDVTTLPRRPAKYFTPHTIGKIIKLISPYTQPLNPEEEESLKAKLYHAISTDIDFDNLLINAQKNIAHEQQKLDTIKKLAQKRAKLNIILIRNKKRIEQFEKQPDMPGNKEKISTAQKNIIAAQKEVTEIEPLILPRKKIERTIHDKNLSKKRLDEFIDYLVGSLQETNQNQYIPYTTHTILLAMLWKIAIHKSDFLTYFKEINATVDSNFISESFTRDEFETFKIALTADPTLILNNYETSSFYAFARRAWSSSLLPIVISSISTARYTQGNKEFFFADCGETSLRNFFNILIFNPLNGTLDFKLLKQTAEQNNFNILPTLEQYYKDYNQMPYIQTKQYYDAWVPVISNLPGIEYNQIENYETSPVLDNILNVFNTLLFGNDSRYQNMSNSQKLDHLINNLSRPNFSLSWRAEKGEYFEENANTPVIDTQMHNASSVDIDHYNVGVDIIFTINNKEDFIWKFDFDHCVIEKPEKKTSTIDNTLVKKLTPKNQISFAHNLVGWFTHTHNIKNVIQSSYSNAEKIFFWMTMPLKNPNIISKLWIPILSSSSLPMDIIQKIISQYPIQLYDFADTIGQAIVQSSKSSLYPLLQKLKFGGKTISALAKSKKKEWHPLIIKNIQSAYDNWDSITDHNSYIKSFNIPELLMIPKAAHLIAQFKNLIILEKALDAITESDEIEYKKIHNQINSILQSPKEKYTRSLENIAAAILHIDDEFEIFDDILRIIITKTKNANIIYHVLEHDTKRFYPTTHPLIVDIESLHKYALNLIDYNDDLSNETMVKIINISQDISLLEKILNKIKRKKIKHFFPLANEIESKLKLLEKEKDTIDRTSNLTNSIIRFTQNLFAQVVAKLTF